MSSEFENYKKTHNEFSLLLEAGKDLIDLQVGLMPNFIHESYAEKIFVKLWCHGNTLLELSPSISKAPNEELWDVSSHYAISRTLIETYDALFYISLDSVDEIERDFRIKFWQLHSKSRREKMLELICSKHPKLRDVKKEVRLLHSQILQHQHLEKCNEEVKDKFKKKRYKAYHISQAKRNSRSGIDKNYYKAVVMQLSSHVHTHPFSVEQLMNFKAGDPECLSLMNVSLQYASGFLAKAINDLGVLFQPRVPNYSPEVKELLIFWQFRLKVGVKKAANKSFKEQKNSVPIYSF